VPIEAGLWKQIPYFEEITSDNSISISSIGMKKRASFLRDRPLKRLTATDIVAMSLIVTRLPVEATQAN